MGILGKDVEDAAKQVQALAAKLNAAIDPPEIRGLILTLNRAAANLLEVSENLKEFTRRLNGGRQMDQ